MMRPVAVRRRCRSVFHALSITLAGGAAIACSPARDSSGPPMARYVPQARIVTITTVPLMVKEQVKVLPFLAEDFAKGGVLEGKEVYAFVPSTITVVEGDTIHFTLINPEDDVHSFVLPDLAVSLPGMKATSATYVARHAGVFPFVCAIQGHLPMMNGQLVVLSAAALGRTAPAIANGGR